MLAGWLIQLPREITGLLGGTPRPEPGQVHPGGILHLLHHGDRRSGEVSNVVGQPLPSGISSAVQDGELVDAKVLRHYAGDLVDQLREHTNHEEILRGAAVPLLPHDAHGLRGGAAFFADSRSASLGVEAIRLRLRTRRDDGVGRLAPLAELGPLRLQLHFSFHTRDVTGDLRPLTGLVFQCGEIGALDLQRVLLFDDLLLGRDLCLSPETLLLGRNLPRLRLGLGFRDARVALDLGVPPAPDGSQITGFVGQILSIRCILFF